MPKTVLHHVIDGSASAKEDFPPLLLGPSIGTTTALWEAVAPALASGRRVVRFDLPGHGGSPTALLPDAAPGATSIADLGELVLALADSLGIAAFDYAGDSLSGAVGLWLAASYPERVGRLAVLCSSAHFGGSRNWQARAAKVREGGSAAMRELADTAPDRWFPAQAPIRDSVTAVELIAEHARLDPAGYAACCDAVAGVDLTTRLGAITAPTLILAGRDDPATPPPHARELVDAISGSTLLELPGVGHLAPAESPERVVTVLREHFGATQPGTAVSTYDAGMVVRRAVLGDEHVDRAVAGTTPFTAPFQNLITRYAWGEIWTRPGLDRRTRSCITLTALVAHGHLDELAMHVRAARNNGLTPNEIGEVLLQSAIYCGVPAANAAFAVAKRVLESEQEGPKP